MPVIKLNNDFPRQGNGPGQKSCEPYGEQNCLNCYKNRKHSLPEHPVELLASPFPENPGLQVQVNDPMGMLEQTAFASHTDGVMMHSLMSANSFKFIFY